MFYTTSDKQKLYYEVHGNANADKTLVFLNGLSQSTAAWNLTYHAFAEEYRIVLLDLIFQGQSDKGGNVRDFDQHAADVKGLVDFLGLKSVILVGISYGSIVAQNFAVNYTAKTEKLILLSTFAHKTPYFEAIEVAWHNALKAGGYALMFDVMLPAVLGEEYFSKPLIPIEVLQKTRQGTNTDPDALMKLMLATHQRPDYREKLKTIKAPTLVVHGEKDILLHSHLGKAVSDAISGSRFVIIPDVGHTLNLEAIPQTVKLVKGFI